MPTVPKKVLLVEDEAIIAMSESRQLEQLGYHVTVAGSGEKAVGIVRADARAFDLVLMDIDLGEGMYGTEAAQEILSLADVPVLFLSSHTEPEMVRRTEEITNYGYVVKASSMTVLDASMKMALKLFEARKSIDRVNRDFEAANSALEESLSDLRKAHDELVISEDKFSKAFHLNPDSINLNRLSDGLYLDINEGFTEIMGYTREDVVGRSSLPGDLGIWVRAEDREALVRGLRERGEVVNLEAEFRKKDGSTTIGLMSAHIVEIAGEKCIISVTKDMGSWRKMQEELLLKSRLLDYADDSIIALDLGGRIVYANEETCRSTGYAKEELLGQPISLLDLPEERTEIASRLAAVTESGKLAFLATHVRKDGSTFAVEVKCVLEPQERKLIIAVHRELEARPARGRS